MKTKRILKLKPRVKSWLEDIGSLAVFIALILWMMIISGALI